MCDHSRRGTQLGKSTDLTAQRSSGRKMVPFKKWRTISLGVLTITFTLIMYSLHVDQYPKEIFLQETALNHGPRLSFSLCNGSSFFLCNIKDRISNSLVWGPAKLSPTSLSICSVDSVTALNISSREVMEMISADDFFEYIENPKKKCRQMVTFGGALCYYGEKTVIDGNKRVCLDPEYNFQKGLFENHLQDSKVSNSCLVYSIGINNEWSFDKDASDFGCQVFAFDPTMTYVINKPELVKYFRIGIGAEDGTKIIGGMKCEVRRFESLLKMLGHDRPEFTIDYFKIDAEGGELDFFEEVLNHSPHLLKKITQIGMEVHHGRYEQKNYLIFHRFYKYFQQLENHGFRLISSAMNPVQKNKYFLNDVQRTVNEYYELVWARDCSAVVLNPGSMDP